MTSHDPLEAAELCRSPASERRKMREFRRPALCVIDENGCEVPETGFTAQSEPSLVNEVKLSFEKLALRDHNANVTNLSPRNSLTIPGDKDLDELMATTARLKLTTRRQSTVSWQQEYLQKPTNSLFSSKFSLSKNDNDDDGFTEERKSRINEALAWLRNELMQMRCEDEVLARKLLSIRHDIQQLKLQRSCQEHADMLEDVAMEMEETEQLNEICDDMPLPGSVIDTSLKQLGVTRMHLSARRFSTC